MEDGPYRPAIGFGEDAIELAKRGRGVAKKDVEVPRQQITTNGPVRQDGDIGPLRQPFYDAVEAYKTTRGADQRRKTRRWRILTDKGGAKFTSSPIAAQKILDE